MKVEIFDRGFSVSMRAADLADGLDLGQDLAEHPMPNFRSNRVKIIVDRRPNKGARCDTYCRFYSETSKPPSVIEITSHYAELERTSRMARPKR